MSFGHLEFYYIGTVPLKDELSVDPKVGEGIFKKTDASAPPYLLVDPQPGQSKYHLLFRCVL